MTIVTTRSPREEVYPAIVVFRYTIFVILANNAVLASSKLPDVIAHMVLQVTLRETHLYAGGDSELTTLAAGRLGKEHTCCRKQESGES